MVNVSVIIPHYPLTPAHDEALERCVKSIRGEYEKIIVVNQGMGFGPAMNLGVKLSSGNFVALVNNDVVCDRFDIKAMAESETVTFPIINGVVQEFSGAFIVIPRSVIDNELGGTVYDERFKVGFWEDVDLWMRLKEANVPMIQYPCNVSHPSPGFTMRHMPDDTDFVNRQIYLEKHGTLPIKQWV